MAAWGRFGDQKGFDLQTELGLSVSHKLNTWELADAWGYRRSRGGLEGSPERKGTGRSWTVPWAWDSHRPSFVNPYTSTTRPAGDLLVPNAA